MSTHSFNAEIGKVLRIVINSIYTNKDIFLRELISNASDAIEKLKYESLTNQSLLPQNWQEKIVISYDKEAKTLTIKDNGIGMDQHELATNLGTIAKSGTESFLQTIQNSKDANLIGQFGVGFYSSFIVADEVVVTSCKAGSNQTFEWKSKGIETFEIQEVQNMAECGTEITLHLKSEETEDYLDKFEIERIVKTYSNHIQIPIEIEHEDGLKKTINSQKALWLKSPKEVSKEEYQDFYKNLTHMADEPLITIHNKVEGVVEYSNLLFVPSNKPFDLYSPERKSSVKLYVNRVFITENNKDILPEYLRFVKGVIDSSDLPLNISRETFQNNKVIEKIRSSVVKKIFGEFKNKMESDRAKYEEFWDKFGNVIKEGLCDYASDKELIMDICLFKTTKSDGKYITISDYIANMQASQEAVYYITGEESEDLQSSPQIEWFKKQNIEVILLNNPVDDFWVNVVIDYKGKDIKNASTADTKVENGTEEKKDEMLNSESLIKECFKKILGDQVKDIQPTNKLVDSPVCLSSESGAMTIRMERYLYEQKQLHKLSAKILEVNVEHPIIKSLCKKYEDNKCEPTSEISDIVQILFDNAALSAGALVQKPNDFAIKVNKMLEKLVA